MPFALGDFVKLRSFVYHVTDQRNLPVLSKRRRLFSAEALIRQSGQTMLLRQYRTVATPIHIGSDTAVLKDNNR
jgi:hypothetical protein